MKPTDRIVFIPETTAFGGAERVLLALSHFLYKQAIPHRFAWYYRIVELARHASWPVHEEHLNPDRSPVRKVQALDNYLRRAQEARAGTVLLVGIQAALHAGLCQTRDYSLLILDTPSLLSGMTTNGLVRLRSQVRERFTRPIIRRALRRARSVMVTSEYMAKEVEYRYGHRAAVVRQGAPLGTFQSRVVKPGEPIRLLSVCRLEANKRVDWILRAVAGLDFYYGLDPHFVRCHLDIVGEGAKRAELQRLTKELNLERRVCFHGRVSDERLEEIYRQAHLFVMPARQGYGLPAREALGRGLPVVVHEDSGVSEILRGSPWVELLTNQVAGLREAIYRMMPRVISGELARHPLPVFPSENDWASAVCRECGWL